MVQEEQKVTVPMALVTNVGTAASGIVTSLLIAAAGQQLDYYAQNITQMLGKNAGVAYNLQKTDLYKVPFLIEDELKSDWQHIIDVIKRGIGQGVGTLHGSLYENLAGANALLQTYHSILHQVAIAPYVDRWANSEYRPNIFNPETAWLLGRIGELPAEKWKENAAMAGWKDEDMPHLAKTWHRTLPLETLLEMLRRGLINEDYFTWTLKFNRLTDTEINAAKQLRTPLYPLPDFIRMVVREAFIPEEVVEAPELMVDYIKNYGWDKVDADRYWTAHFIRMDLRQAYENLWRGHFTEEDFKRYLRLADIHPKDWDAIIRVAYRPPTLRELGYGYDVGVYSLDDIIMYRRWAGLSKADAEKAAQAMIAYRTEAEREAVRRALLRLYVYGHITRQQFQKGLEEVKTAPAAIPLWLQRGDLEKQLRTLEASVEEPRSLKRSDIQWGYEHNIRTKEWCAKTLTEIGFPEEVAAYYTEQSSARLKESELEALRREYTTLYAMGKIDKATLEKKLTDLNTHPEVIPLWLEKAELEKQKRERPPPETVQRNITPSEALWAFEYDLRTEEWTRRILEENYWTPERINLAIEHVKKLKELRVKPPKEVKYKELTLSHLESLHYYGKIRAEELPTRIQALGYDPEDSRLLATLIVTLVEERKTREEEETLRRQERSRDQIIAKTFTALKDENITMYVEGLRTEDQIRLNYREIGVPEELIDLLIAEANLKYEIEEKRDWKRIYLDAYRLGDIDDTWLIALLLSIPIQPDVVKREYIKARMRKTPRTPLKQILEEYPKLETEARRLIAG